MAVQTVDRAVGILNCLGHSGEAGMRLVDLQRALGLKRPTVHRILASLIAVCSFFAGGLAATYVVLLVTEGHASSSESPSVPSATRSPLEPVEPVHIDRGELAADAVDGDPHHLVERKVRRRHPVGRLRKGAVLTRVSTQSSERNEHLGGVSHPRPERPITDRSGRRHQLRQRRGEQNLVTQTVKHAATLDGSVSN